MLVEISPQRFLDAVSEALGDYLKLLREGVDEAASQHRARFAAVHRALVGADAGN